MAMAACSPKVRPVVIQPKKEPKPPVEQPVIVKIAPPRVSTVSLLLPFGLNHLQPGSAYSSSSLKEADIALDYYRGFKLALDSLTGLGYNYKLQVFDSRDEKVQAHKLAANPAVRASNLIVGPVFPDDIKAFTAAFNNDKQPIVSPLSASSPANYKNAGLITITPPLEYHAWAAAKYINDKLKPRKVFILKSGFSDENDYIIPFNKAIDSLSRKRIKVIQLTVLHGQLNLLVPQLSASGQNVFVVPATNRHFLTVTLGALDTLSSTFPVTLIGHPSWISFSFLKADLLQRLNTCITSSDQVDYKDVKTIAFIRSYKLAYHTEPTGYAIKGFDEGFYLGKLLGTDSLKNIASVGFTGLHNSFHFQKKTGAGWVNTHVDVLKYADFELKKVE
jgi:hypothetical protein